MVVFTGWLFASSCSPPRLSATQLLSATKGQLPLRSGLSPICWSALVGALATVSSRSKGSGSRAKCVHQIFCRLRNFEKVCRDGCANRLWISWALDTSAPPTRWLRQWNRAKAGISVRTILRPIRPHVPRLPHTQSRCGVTLARSDLDVPILPPPARRGQGVLL
jgi:hypothetical protein